MRNISDKSKTVILKDSRRLSYLKFGDPKGKPLFFFHGFPGSRYSGRETDEAAKKLGVRVISTDRPGIGLSDFQKDRKLLDWPDDVCQLADYLKIKKFSVLGVSGGGPYAAACAYKISERLAAAGIVVGLAPTNVKSNLKDLPFLNRFGWAHYHHSRVVRNIGAFGAALQFKYFPKIGLSTAFPTKTDREKYREIVGKFPGKESETKEAFRQGIKGLAYELKLYSGDWGFNLKDIKTKVYLWYSAKDECVSLKMGEYYHVQIPGSELFIDQAGGHLARYDYEKKILRKLIKK